MAASRTPTTLRRVGFRTADTIAFVTLQHALADGLPIDRADGSARNLSESEALEAWRAGHALRVRQ